MLALRARTCDRQRVRNTRRAARVTPLALTAVAVACAPAPLNLSPLPAPAPVCPAAGCGPRAEAPASGATSGDCLSVGGEACAGAPAAECTARALAAWDELRGDPQRGRGASCVASKLSDACAKGDAQACVFAGRLWLEGSGVRPDPTRGLALLTAQCDAGVTLACAAALRWLDDPAHKSEADDLRDLHSRLASVNGCWLGEGLLCVEIGRLYRLGGEGVSPDVPQSARIFARGCDLGERASCNWLGVALTYGDGIARDLERAVALYDRSCRLGFPLGCANLGYMLERGAGVARDEARARTLYRNACLSGESYGCRHVDLMDAETRGVPREGDAALRYWQRRCDDAKDARACAFVSLLYLDGPDGFARDEAKSAQMLSLACRRGYARACEWESEGDDE